MQGRLEQATVAPAAAGDLRWLAIALSAGILLVMALPELPGTAVCAALAVTALLRTPVRLPWMGFVLGVLLATWHGQVDLAQRWPVQRHGERVWVQGHIASLPERGVHPSDSSSDWRFRFDAHQAGVPQHIRVSWYRSAISPKAGQCWRFLLRMRSPHGSMNPGAFDYEAWMLREDLGATASVQDALPCADAGDAPVLHLRQAIADRIRANAGTTRGAALLAALTVGDTSALTPEDWSQLRVTGTTHLVAISGLHLGIVAGLAFFALRWLWTLVPILCLWIPAQRIGLYGSGVVAAAYALLAGFEAPVTRALIMLWVLIGAAATHRLHQPSRALAAAWVLILVLDPFAILSPGLWLSFGAILTIFYVSLGRRRAPPWWRLTLRLQLALSLALVPLTLHFFQGFAWLSVPVNLIAVPVFSLLTPIALAAVLCLAISPSLGAWAVQNGSLLLGRAVDLISYVAEHAPGAWVAASPSWPSLLAAGIGIVLLLVPRGIPLRGLAVPCLAGLLLSHDRASPDLQVAVLDVGQGSAIVVRTRAHALLFDAGPAYEGGFDAGAAVVAPYLLSRGDSELDMLLLSHTDNDHAGGVGAVRELLRVDRELGTDGGVPCGEGRSWQWDGVRFELLHPDAGPWKGNNRSCVLKVDGPFSVLLPGDIEGRAERRLVAEHGGALAADVLLAPHHGSGTSSTPAFVDAVHPRIVVHSAGWHSRFGHPRADVVDRYRHIGAEQYTTGVVGAVTIGLDEDGRLVVDAYRRRAAHWWNAAPEP